MRRQDLVDRLRAAALVQLQAERDQVLLGVRAPLAAEDDVMGLQEARAPTPRVLA